MDPANNYSNRELARINPALALEGLRSYLINEWREVPEIWDAVSFDFDKEHLTGEYIDGTVFQYEDNNGLEINAIMELRDGTWGAFEIKLGEHQVETAARSLLRLRDKMALNGAPPPACLCVITGGGFGRLREDGIYVVPVNALGP